MRVVVVSTHRADKAHYAPLLRCLRATPGLDVVLYAANDFYEKPDYDRSIQLDNATQGKNARGFDAGIVLGDRYEMLVAAAQLVEMRVPLLHIHGGEHTYGSLDERWRWAMTAIADVHCVATESARGALLGRVTQPFTTRVHVTGAPGLDDIQERTPFPNAPKIVVLYNPAIDEETTRRESAAIWTATNDTDAFFARPNGDRFSDVIPWADAPTELDSEKFRDLLASAHVIVGNSSAGIIEAPSLGTWTVNVGERQAGRPRAASVYDCPAESVAIRDRIELDLMNERATGTANPYGDGGASARIRDVLLGMAK